MIKIIGTAKLRVQFLVELDMTEDEFDALSERKQNEIMDSRINWSEIGPNAVLDDIEVDDLESI